MARGMARMEAKLDALCEALADEEGEDDTKLPTTLDGHTPSLSRTPRATL